MDAQRDHPPTMSAATQGKGKEKEQDDENFVDLFGKWQTEEYVPRMALNVCLCLCSASPDLTKTLLVKGIVPKNEFGNVYLFKPSMLPVGTVHVKCTKTSALIHSLVSNEYTDLCIDPNALTIAKRINVDCAAAMVSSQAALCSIMWLLFLTIILNNQVGWRWASARSVPEIEGIIVCEEYAGLIEEVKSSLFSCS